MIFCKIHRHNSSNKDNELPPLRVIFSVIHLNSENLIGKKIEIAYLQYSLFMQGHNRRGLGEEGCHIS